MFNLSDVSKPEHTSKSNDEVICTNTTTATGKVPVTVTGLKNT